MASPFNGPYIGYNLGMGMVHSDVVLVNRYPNSGLINPLLEISEDAIGIGGFGPVTGAQAGGIRFLGWRLCGF